MTKIKPKKNHPWRKPFSFKQIEQRIKEKEAYWFTNDDLNYLPIQSDEDIIEEYTKHMEKDIDIC